MEISVKRKVLMLFGFAAAMAIGGCGNREPENILPSGTDVAGLESVRAGNENGESRGNAGPGGATEPLQEDSRKDVPQGQILEQSFDVFLDGWGEVVFASFEPEEDLLQKDGIWEYGDARFMLLRDGQVIYTFPSMFEEDVMAGQQFGEVVSVSFRDYNVDGRPDVLLLLKYAGVQGIDIGQEWVEARAYTQEDGGAECSGPCHYGRGSAGSRRVRGLVQCGYGNERMGGGTVCQGHSERHPCGRFPGFGGENRVSYCD